MLLLTVYEEEKITFIITRESLQKFEYGIFEVRLSPLRK